MNKSKLDKLVDAIAALPPEELYKSLFGFYEADYIEYLNDKQYEFEAQYILDVMNKLDCKEINVYDGEIQPPTQMFFHYLRNNATEGTDEDFWGGWGAETLDVPNFPIRYLWVNGQGTEHFFQIIGSTDNDTSYSA